MFAGKSWKSIVPAGAQYSQTGEHHLTVIVGHAYVYADPNYDGVGYYLSMDGNDLAPGQFTATVGIVTINGDPDTTVDATLTPV